jgi:alkanesulfonate monooxygenase
VPFRPIDEVRTVFAALDQACAAIERDPDSMVRSVALVACGGESAPAFSRRAAAIGREVDELRAVGCAGTPDQMAERLEMFASIGVTRVYLQVLDLTDLDHIRLLGERLGPLVA